MKSFFQPDPIGGGQATTAQPATPPTPRPIRQPTETDPTIVQAGRRTRRAAMQRRGRLSTILTDRSRETVGSSGQTLGA